MAGEGEDYQLHDGSIVIASITSCTNTSNPYVMIGAGLVARKARALGLTRKPWVKTSLAPGSQVVSPILRPRTCRKIWMHRFQPCRLWLHHLHRQLGPACRRRSARRSRGRSDRHSVLSGNRNFEGRISPDVRANYLASPPLVVAYALVGDMNVDLANGSWVRTRTAMTSILKDIWPSTKEVAELVEKTVTREAFQEKYADVFKGDEKVAGRRRRPDSHDL